ncbi:MAG: hypothetical protein KY476_05725 [Planctomycetes bacterium]|nr:hypothetical protein [Planctomycetota bacterium]
MKISVLGAGAIGSMFGGLIKHHGPHADVLLIGRGEHGRAMSDRGRVRLVGPWSTRDVPVRVSFRVEDIAGSDFLLFCVKSHATVEAARAAAPYLGKAVVISMQNGINEPALVQHVRAEPDRDPEALLDEPLDTQFTGHLLHGDEPFAFVEGRVELAPVPSPHGLEIIGTFRGTAQTRRDQPPEAIELELSDQPRDGGPFGPHGFQIGQKVAAGPRRILRCDVAGGTTVAGRPVSRLDGTIPRSFLNRFEAPASNDRQNELERELGKFLELARVFTWVAGLLNILAIWDALEGPAYGYGDEAEDGEDEPKKVKAGGDEPQPNAAEEGSETERGAGQAAA